MEIRKATLKDLPACPGGKGIEAFRADSIRPYMGWGFGCGTE